MMQLAFIGIAAGATSALLFASITSGSLLSIPLFNLAPLPILIAAIGWSHLAGLIAAVFAATALAAIFGGLLFLNFLLGIGLPAWWLAYLVLLARPAESATPDRLEWYPVGRIVVWASLISAVIVAAIIFIMAGDAETLRTSLRRSLESFIRVTAPPGTDASADRPKGILLQQLLDHPDRVLPPAAAVLTTLMQVFTLWLAARVARISGRLRRPWPQLSAMTFPPMVLAVLTVLLVGSFMSGMVGILASIATASLLTAYALLGLAVLHTLTRALNARGFILGSVYGAIAVFGWPLLLMSLIGLADAALDLRGRTGRRGPPSIST